MIIRQRCVSYPNLHEMISNTLVIGLYLYSVYVFSLNAGSVQPPNI